MLRIIQTLRSLDPYALRHAISTLLVISISLAIIWQHPYLQSSWLILASILFSQVGLKNEWDWQPGWQLADYFLASLCAVAAIFVLGMVSNYFLLTAFVLLIITSVTSYLGRIHRKLFYPGLVINLLSIAAAFSPTFTVEERVERCAFIVVGCLLAYVIKAIFSLYQQPRRANDARIIYFQKLQKLFYCIFTADTENNLYEQKFQSAWTTYLAALQILRRYTSQKQIAELEKIGDITFSLGSLRYRINDQAVLNMGRVELQGILNAVIKILEQLGKSNEPLHAESLSGNIQSLESLYESMLQTLTKEPLVLLLFIQDLYALERALSEVSHVVIPETTIKENRLTVWNKVSVWIPTLRSSLAVVIALISTYFFSEARTFWLPFTAVLLTQTEMALPLHQILQRVLWVLLLFIAVTNVPLHYISLVLLTAVPFVALHYAYSSRGHLSLHLSLLMIIVITFAATVPVAATSTPYLLDIVIGALIGIVCNLVIYPDKADQEFSKRVVPILKASSDYFRGLMATLLANSADEATLQSSRLLLENFWANRDAYFPIWVFEPGFNPALRPGQYYFAVHLGQITEMLFAMQHFVRHSFDPELLAKLSPALEETAQRTLELFAHMVTLLEGKKPAASDNDPTADIIVLEDVFRTHVNVTLELLDISRDYVYLAALVRYLKDLRSQLLQLISTLRT